MAEPMKLKVDTGAVSVDVENENGRKIGEFEFNPSDSNILKRYETVVDFFNKIELKEYETDEENIAQMNKLSDDICSQFDFLLGHNVSDGIFGECGALTIVNNGDFFFETVLEGIGGLIETVTQKRLDKKLKKIQKVTAKYKK